MRKHTSWRAGGTGAIAPTCPRDLDDLRAFPARLAAATSRFSVVGLGSNLLVRDGGIRGTVVFTHGALNGIVRST